MPTFSIQDHLAANSKRHQPPEPSFEDALSDASRETAAAGLAARSPSPTRRPQHHPASSWMSPGKAAASAAAAAAKEAARAAAASVRAAEAAADAAEAAEAAAEAEEEEMCSRSPGGGGGGGTAFRSPPPASEFRERRSHSPAREAFWLTEGDKDGAVEHNKGASSGPRPEAHAPTESRDGGGGGESGDGATPRGERVPERRRDEGSGGRHKDDFRAPAARGHGGGSSEEEMLRKARDQVTRGKACS